MLEAAAGQASTSPSRGCTHACVRAWQSVALASAKRARQLLRSRLPLVGLPGEHWQEEVRHLGFGEDRIAGTGTCWDRFTGTGTAMASTASSCSQRYFS